VAVLSLGKREGAAASWKPEELLGPGRRAEHRGADGEGRGPGCFDAPRHTKMKWPGSIDFAAILNLADAVN
jgi:hypothetical protein